jgi:hypothetical protein
MSLSPEQRRMRARIAALARSAAGPVDTGPARRAFMARFEEEVDPDGTLPPAERARRAEAAKRLHFARLRFARSKAS